MGIVDVKIDIQRDYYWKLRNRRIRSLKARSNRRPPQSNAVAVADDVVVVSSSMDFRLYRYCSDGRNAEKESFEALLERVRQETAPTPPERDVILRSTTPLGNTVLHIAAEHGHTELVEAIDALCEDSSLLLRQNFDGDTALHIAARIGEGPMVAKLGELQKKYGDVNTPQLHTIINKQGNTVVHVAVKNNPHEKFAENLVDHIGGTDVDAFFRPNNEGKSALYIAAEVGSVNLVNKMLAAVPSDQDLYEKTKTSSLLHAAILGKHQGILNELLEREPKLIHLRNAQRKNPLHLAAETGYVEGVTCLLPEHRKAVLERDEKGFSPLHWAAFQGHVPVMAELLKNCPHHVELLDNKDQNILHVAARCGRHDVIAYLLNNTPNFEKLLNAKDKDANTPLLLATINWHPRIVSTLTWVRSVNLEWINNDGLTALDAAEHYMDDFPSFRQRLTWTALRSAAAPRAPSDKFLKYNKDFTEKPNPLASMMGNYKDRINTLLLVATLVATITFAAGFTVPGGYNNSGSDEGFATLVGYSKFHLFVVCNTIAMYSAIIVAVALIWAQMGDLHLMLTALRVGLPMLGVSISMMSLAFMAGLDLAVTRRNWLSDFVLVTGLLFLAILVVLVFPLCFPISSPYLLLRYISYYPFLLLIFFTGSYTASHDSD